MLRRIAAILILTLGGCTPRDQSLGKAADFRGADGEHVLLLIIDQSPEFRERIGPKLEEFSLKVVEQYFKRANPSDRLVIAQPSDKDHLIWEGNPRDLKRQFATVADFRAFVRSKAAPKARLCVGIREVIQYVLAGINKEKVAVVILSSMEDGESSELERGYMNHEFYELGHRHAAVGLFFLSEEEMRRWQVGMIALGVKNFRLWSGAVGMPPVPSFE